MPTSIADQTTAQLGGQGSILARQRRDHVDLDVLLRQVRSTSGQEQDEALNRVYRLVFSHAFAEEAVLWPALRRLLPDGEQLTLQVEQEHQEVNEHVTRLERMPVEDPARPALLDRVVDLLRQDVRDEEDELLPRLQQVASPRALRRLGRAFDAVRRVAPTRPHPLVARRPPGNVLAALPLTVVDRSRDAADALARRVPPAAAPLPATVSRGLAAVSAGIERLGPLQRGEDRSTREGRTGSGR